ncbi:FAD-binding oxidoreductase [Primorskyibacter flagellatus]|uniref:FAD/FMN-containing dehydrogenase n=1 Tax=Primorskyibacter flagellatus TaxID=1387277 RepID=A0A1W2CVX1_9RHOB|nr:FAD-binding oxidoreductase [Primorskyibacter flagellatus]SMC88992.1 FAD/FMN-containing dehydrogenase [Primorskyibacter flagellatus]
MLNAADAEFVERLAGDLPDDTLRPAEPRYLEEPRGAWMGKSEWVALPRTVEEAATILRACQAARVGIVPYGGGTGLVGGQVSGDGPQTLVLSLERMSAIRAVYPQENVLIAEAGATLADVQAAAETESRLFPLSLASEGTARIGGNLSTNAGGVNVLRYGNARDLCLGLEAVLPDGQIWHGLRRLRKDNTGYDLRHLLIGAEGTLGIITAAALKLSPIPAGRGTAIMAVRDPASALALLSLARDQIGEAVSAFELIDRTGTDFLAEKLPDVRLPFDPMPEWMVLIEVGLPRGLVPSEALEELFVAAFDAGLVTDGLVAQSDTQRAEFWTMRESIPLANRQIGAIASHDTSVPLGALPEFIARGRKVIAAMGDFRVNCFGHVGDGNLHFNIFPPKGRNKAEFSNLKQAMTRAVHDLVHDMEGSLSAEHGIGRLKVDDLARYGDPAKLSAMRAIKSALDPAGILNPGAVLPAA